MAPRPHKSVSFKAMVKFFMQQYEIPTKRDIDRILSRLERLEPLVQNAGTVRRKDRLARSRRPIDPSNDDGGTALSIVLAALQGSSRGMTVKAMEEATGFDAKKIRNCFYRLGKQARITRTERGTYVAIN